MELTLQQQKIYTLELRRVLFKEINKPIPHVNRQYINKRIQEKKKIIFDN
jgi:hypothetical protein